MAHKILGIIMFFIASATFSLSLQETPNPSLIYEAIEKGTVPEMTYPIFVQETPKVFSFDITPNFYLTNLNTSPVSSWYNVVVDGSTPTNIFNDLPPFMKMTLHYSGNSAALHFELFVRRSYNAFLKWPDTTAIITPQSPYVSFDSSFPYDAYIAFNTPEHRLIIGRTKISWGYWVCPVSISPSPPYFDNLTYEFKPFDWFKYTFNMISINPILTPEEYEVQKEFKPVNSDNIVPYDEKVKTLVAHRLEFHPLKNFTWAIGELGMFGGKVPDIYSLNPVTIWHNLYDAAYINVIGSFQVAWTFLPGWNFYFDFALDDFAVPLTEKEDVKPSAYGLSTGIYKSLSFFDFNILLHLSYSYTSQWVYNMFLPYLKFDTRYIILSNFPVPARAIYSYPIGFKYGPDAALISLKINIWKEKLSASFEIFNLTKGPATIITEYKSQLPDIYENFLGLKARIDTPWNLSINLFLLNTIYHVGIDYKLSF